MQLIKIEYNNYGSAFVVASNIQKAIELFKKEYSHIENLNINLVELLSYEIHIKDKYRHNVLIEKDVT
jgi:hypothetical protein